MIGPDGDRHEGKREDELRDAPAEATEERREHLPDRPGLRALVRVMMITVVLLALVRIFVFEPYRIPTGSMRPTILEGDVLLVNKLPYTIRSLRFIPFTHIPVPYVEFPGLGSLERGDVVVFDFPGPHDPSSSESEHYVKRCLAVRGDSVQLIDGLVYVNGHEVPRAPGDPGTDGHRTRIAQSRAFELLRYRGRIVVPYKGYRVQLDSSSAERWRPLIEGEGVSVVYRNRIVFLSGLPATGYTFRHDYFFALGDNSSDSYDSRFFGFVPYDNLIGEPLMIYWSRELDGKVRWSRIGRFVR